MSNRTNSLNQMPNYWSDGTSNAQQQSIALNHAHHLHHQVSSATHHQNDHLTTTTPAAVAVANFVSGDHTYDHFEKYNSNVNSSPLQPTAPNSATPTHQTVPVPLCRSASVSAPTTRSASKRYMTRNSSTYNSYQTPKQTAPEVPQNVAFRPLPFYDQLCEIISPTVLRSDGTVGKANESQIEFRLTIDMADAVAMTKETTNIILRFCHIDPQSMEQDDNFPPDIVITVNGKQITLPPAISNPNRPNVPAKRPGQHVNITKECKLCPFSNNQVNVKWFVDPTDTSKQYACSMIIGEKQTTETLLNRIVMKGLSDSKATMKLIADSDTEVATMNLQCSLLCPLGKMRMSSPCKSIKCKHIPCFDASVYLQMNEKKATWICPVCYKPAYFPDLVIDEFFKSILDNTSSSITEVTLNLDGSWSPVLKIEQQPASTKNISGPEIITISDDDDDD